MNASNQLNKHKRQHSLLYSPSQNKSRSMKRIMEFKSLSVPNIDEETLVQLEQCGDSSSSEVESRNFGTTKKSNSYGNIQSLGENDVPRTSMYFSETDRVYKKNDAAKTIPNGDVITFQQYISKIATTSKESFSFFEDNKPILHFVDVHYSSDGVPISPTIKCIDPAGKTLAFDRNEPSTSELRQARTGNLDNSLDEIQIDPVQPEFVESEDDKTSELDSQGKFKDEQDGNPELLQAATDEKKNSSENIQDKAPSSKEPFLKRNTFSTLFAATGITAAVLITLGFMYPQK